MTVENPSFEVSAAGWQRGADVPVARTSHDEGRVCLCMNEHRPAPLELNRHHIWPLGMGGSDTEDNVVWICPTTHTNVHELMRFILNGTLTDWRSALDMYEAPVNRYAWQLAVEGVRRFREGSAAAWSPSG